MLGKYFYVVNRDGQIIELPFKEITMNAVLGAMRDKGLVSLLNNSIILNGVDISKVMSDEQYDEYVKNVRPKEYIKNGVWYDGKENGILRYAKWRQEEIDSKKRLETKMEDIKELPGARERIKAMIQFNIDKYKNFKK